MIPKQVHENGTGCINSLKVTSVEHQHMGAAYIYAEN